MHIRLATIEDYPSLALIGRESQDLHYQAHPTIFQSDTEGFTQEHVREQIAGEQTAIYVAEDQGQILGYVFPASTATLLYGAFSATNGSRYY